MEQPDFGADFGLDSPDKLLARGGQYAAMYEWFVSPEAVLGV